MARHQLAARRSRRRTRNEQEDLAELISHAVWRYYRFALSHRDSEDLLAERGVEVSYEAVRLWCRTFGPAFTTRLRRHRRPAAGKWHLDELQLKIGGRKHWLWRAVDADGLVLDILVQERRNQEAAERFLRRVLDGVLLRGSGEGAGRLRQQRAGGGAEAMVCVTCGSEWERVGTSGRANATRAAVALLCLLPAVHSALRQRVLAAPVSR